MPTPAAGVTEMPVATEAGMAEDEWGTVIIAPGDTIRIGMGAAQSGNAASLGEDEFNGADLAIQDLGQDVMGWTVELVKADDSCGSDGGTAVANKFAADETIVGVIGMMCSSATTPAIPILEEAHIVMISPSSTAPQLTEGNVIFNRVCWNDRIQGRAAAEFVYETLGLRKAALIHDQSPYGEALVGVFRDTFTGLGGEITATEAISTDSSDFRSTLTNIAQGQPELIYFGGFQREGALLVQQKNEVGLQDAILLGADGIKSDVYIQTARDAANGSYASFAASPEGTGLEEFKAAYKAAYGKEAGELGPFNAHAYDAVGVMIDAMKRVATQDDDGNLVIGRKALADAVRATSGYSGLTGTITCDANGDCGSADITFFKVEDGKWVEAGG
jgi:branched-chain amino acid transport system substrate-binding protein